MCGKQTDWLTSSLGCLLAVYECFVLFFLSFLNVALSSILVSLPLQHSHSSSDMLHEFISLH